MHTYLDGGMRAASTILLLAILSCTDDGRRTDATPPTALLGCYSVLDSSRTLVAAGDRFTPHIRLDSTILLSQVPGSVPRGLRWIAMQDSTGQDLPSLDPRKYMLPFWTWDSLTDSLHLSSGGFSGTFIDLNAVLGTDTLYGRYGYYSDLLFSPDDSGIYILGPVLLARRICASARSAS